MDTNNSIPREEGLDNTLDLIKEGYLYISKRCEEFNSDMFETRVLGKKAVCMRGKEAAKLFYDTDKFIRHGAAPKRVQKTLLGEGGVQSLDGKAHHHRKAMFMNHTNKDSLGGLRELTKKHWDVAIDNWINKEEINFYDESKVLIIKIACNWAGVPLKEDEVYKRAEEMAEMYETPATIALEQHKGRQARRNSEKWIRDMVEDIRQVNLNPPEDSVLYNFAFHKDLEGNLLDPDIVAVEVLNILRPMVAISVYMNFMALALHQHPEEKAKLRTGDEEALERFVQEVRRYYPFFPFNGAKVKEDFTWNGYDFEKDTLVLLDFYGTNHHPEIWDNSEEFDPDRFKEWDENKYDFVPQGGGDYHTNHRCAGEWVTLDIMKISLDYLVNKITYDVPEQDLDYSMVDIPSLPKSRFIMKNIKRV